MGAALTAQEVWQQLLEGNQRFVKGSPLSRNLPALRESLVKGQNPMAAVLCCSPFARAEEGLGLVKDRRSGAFVGQDLRIGGPRLIAHRLDSGQNILVFPAGCSMTIGAHQYASASSVVWIESVRLGSEET